jgi:hypothetical protein
MVHRCIVTTHKSPLMQQKIASHAEALEISMNLESTPMGESSSGISHHEPTN